MPIDYRKYSKDWKDIIRPDILRRANYRCENCNLLNHIWGYRLANGSFVECTSDEIDKRKVANKKVLLIVLSIAHLDNDPSNNNYQNLKCLCQRCHNKQDNSNRLKTRFRNKASRTAIK